MNGVGLPADPTELKERPHGGKWVMLSCQSKDKKILVQCFWQMCGCVGDSLSVASL